MRIKITGVFKGVTKERNATMIVGVVETVIEKSPQIANIEVVKTTKDQKIANLVKRAHLTLIREHLVEKIRVECGKIHNRD